MNLEVYEFIRGAACQVNQQRPERVARNTYGRARMRTAAADGAAMTSWEGRGTTWRDWRGGSAAGRRAKARGTAADDAAAATGPTTTTTLTSWSRHPWRHRRRRLLRHVTWLANCNSPRPAAAPHGRRTASVEYTDGAGATQLQQTDIDAMHVVYTDSTQWLRQQNHCEQYSSASGLDWTRSPGSRQVRTGGLQKPQHSRPLPSHNSHAQSACPHWINANTSVPQGLAGRGGGDHPSQLPQFFSQRTLASISFHSCTIWTL